jgi:chromosome segregation ATPase
VDKNRPVTKVINLLKDMQKQLEKEADEDEEIYNKMACWCTNNDKEKTKAIADAEDRINNLVSTIEEKTATSSRLSTEITNLETEVSKNQAALDKATAIRTKDLADFNADEKDMLQSISALKSAIVVLSKHHSDAFLDMQLEDTQVAMESLLRRHSAMLGDMLSALDMRAVRSFVKAPEAFLDQSAPEYAAQSGEVYGILKNMLSTFEANLSQSQKDEMNSQAGYEELKSAKEDEIKEGQNHLDSNKEQLASTDEDLANAKEDLEDTRNSLSADQKFLMNLKQKCQQTDQEYEERQKTRQEEISAVSEALSFLTSDDAHDLFTRTFNFAQMDQSVESLRRQNAAQVLSAAGRRLASSELVALASSVKLDAFTKVKKAIDDMIAKLLQDKEDEIKHKDYCVDEINTNERENDLKNRDKEEKEAHIETMKNEIHVLSQELDTLKAEIQTLQTELKRAGEDREAENKDFQDTVADQRATIKLLQKTLDVLKGFYDKKHKGASLAQEDPAGPPPPPGFKAYKKNEGSGGVLGMIQQIIGDAKAEEAEAIQAEKDAQAAYELYVKDTNDSVTSKNDSITNKSDTKAKKEGALHEDKKDLNNIMTELEELSNENADLHKACDFTLKNFDIRQSARDEEVEALREAKAVLSGAKFEALVQSAFLQRSK